MTRRDARPSILVLAILIISSSGTIVADEERPPNILLLLADNWAWPHASICGDTSVKTPTFDRLAREGRVVHPRVLPSPFVLASPGCAVDGPSLSPARGRCQPVGQVSGNIGDLSRCAARIRICDRPHDQRLGTGHVPWPAPPATHPAGDAYASFDEFLSKLPDNKPFCFWFGSHDPHQPWNRGADFRGELDEAQVDVPPYVPDHQIVRESIVNYYSEVQRFDHECGEILERLTDRGLRNNTLVIMVGDNGWQMPRGLANVYDIGHTGPDGHLVAKTHQARSDLRCIHQL